MRNIRLSEKEQKILSAVHFRADASVPLIQRETGFRGHTIRYALERLREQEAIQYSIVVDSYGLGYTEYEFYFSLAAKSRKVQKRVVDWLKASHVVTWMRAFGGDFQFGLVLCCRNINEVSEFIDSLTDRFGGVLFEKSLVVRTSFTLFRMKFDALDKTYPRQLAYGVASELQRIDATDQAILSALCAEPSRPKKKQAELLGLPLSSFDYRVKRLKTKGIIKGFTYRLDESKLGMHVYVLHLYAKGVSRGLREQLLRFCQGRKEATNLVTCIGEWDYEIGLRVIDPQEVVDICQELYEKYRPEITKIRVLPLFRTEKVSGFPIETE